MKSRKTLKISTPVAQKDYNGCGRAWAAIKNGEIVGLRYMGQFSFDVSKAPPWVAAVHSEYRIICDPSCSISIISPTGLGKIKKAAISAGHPEFGPRGGHIKASTIAADARRVLQDLEKSQFGDYRALCRKELSTMGEVVSGMCSCWEFVANV